MALRWILADSVWVPLNLNRKFGSAFGGEQARSNAEPKNSTRLNLLFEENSKAISMLNDDANLHEDNLSFAGVSALAKACEIPFPTTRALKIMVQGSAFRAKGPEPEPNNNNNNNNNNHHHHHPSVDVVVPLSLSFRHSAGTIGHHPVPPGNPSSHPLRPRPPFKPRTPNPQGRFLRRVFPLYRYPPTTSHPACARFRLRRRHLHQTPQPQPSLLLILSTVKNLLEGIAEMHWWIAAAQERPRPRYWLRSDTDHDDEAAASDTSDTAYAPHRSSVPLLRRLSSPPSSVPRLPSPSEPAPAVPGPLGLG
ncbi:hypothetical protein B0H11DRAFT_1923014 [Mycena galericulata]|nr:hypothetical protein B0H11DRAFT_1923014 [Mycena galericulata]